MARPPVETDPFLREVDEEYRREQLGLLWKRYGGLAVAAAFLVIAGVGGWRYWQHRELTAQQAAAVRFDDALQLSRDGKGQEAEAVFAALVTDAPAGYRVLARFRGAAQIGLGSEEAGAKAFETLAADGTIEQPLRDLARLRADVLRLDGDAAAAATGDLERIAASQNPWRHTAREALGLAAMKRGDLDGASRWFDQIAADRETPAGLRARLEIYSALAAGGPVATTQ